MQNIGNVNNAMNIIDGDEYFGSRAAFAINNADPSKEIHPYCFNNYEKRIPAVDSLDDVLGASGDSDDASRSFDAVVKYSPSRNIKDHSCDGFICSGEGPAEVNSTKNHSRTIAVGLDANDKPKPALLGENRNRSQSPRKVTFNNFVEPIGNTVISPRSNSLQRALQRIKKYSKPSRQSERSSKPPTPYKVNTKEPSRLSRSLQIDTSPQDKGPSIVAKLSPAKVSCTRGDSKVPKGVAKSPSRITCPKAPVLLTAEKYGERLYSSTTPENISPAIVSCTRGDSKVPKGVAKSPSRITCPKAPVLLTAEKYGERLYSSTTPENKRNALKSPMSDPKEYGRQKTETMQELRNKFFEDFRFYPTIERSSPRTTVPKPFSLRTEERIAIRHYIHHTGSIHEEEEPIFRPFKALPMPNYEADPLFHGIRKDWTEKRHTTPEPFQLSSLNNTPGKLVMSVDDECVGRYRFRALPVPDFSYRPSSHSSHEVNLTTPFPFNLQLDQRMASRIRFNGTARTNMLAKMYVRACSIVDENNVDAPEIEVGKSRYKTETVSNTTKQKTIPYSNKASHHDVNKKMPNVSMPAIRVKTPLSPAQLPKSNTSTPRATLSPRRNNFSSTQPMVRSAPSTPTGTPHCPARKTSFKARKMPDFSKPFVPSKKPPSPRQPLPNTFPQIATNSPRSSNTSVSQVRSAPTTPTGSSPKDRNSFKAKKMPDFSKPFVPLKKPPSPIQILPAKPPRIATSSPRSSYSVRSAPSTPKGVSQNSEADLNTKIASFSESSTPSKKQPSLPQCLPTPPPRMVTASPQRTNSSIISSHLSSDQSITAGLSTNRTTMFKARKMPDFSKPFVPVTKPPSPLQNKAISPSRSATCATSTSSIDTTKSKHFQLLDTSPSKRLSQSIESQIPASPQSTLLTYNNEIKLSEHGITESTSSRSQIMSPLTTPKKTVITSTVITSGNELSRDTTRSCTNEKKASNSVTNRSRNPDLKSIDSIKINEQFSARRMPDFSKPFLPVKTTDIERALVHAVAKDNHLLEVLDRKLIDYKNRLMSQEFGQITNDLDGQKKIRQLADLIVREVLDDVEVLKPSPSMTSTNRGQTMDASKAKQHHDSEMTKTALKEDFVNVDKRNDSGLSVSSHELSADPCLSFAETISLVDSTKEEETTNMRSAVRYNRQHSADFASATLDVSEMQCDNLSQRDDEICHETTDHVDSFKDQSLASLSSFSRVPSDDVVVSHYRGVPEEECTKRAKDIDEKLFQAFSSKEPNGRTSENELESVNFSEEQERTQVCRSNEKWTWNENVSQSNTALLDLRNSVMVAKAFIANNRQGTDLVSTHTAIDESYSKSAQTHLFNMGSDSNGSCIEHRHSKHESGSTVVGNGTLTSSDCHSDSRESRSSEEEKSTTITSKDGNGLKGKVDNKSSLQEPTCHSPPSIECENSERKEVISKHYKHSGDVDHDQLADGRRSNTSLSRNDTISPDPIPTSRVNDNTADMVNKSDNLNHDTRPRCNPDEIIEVDENIRSTKKDIPRSSLLSPTSTDSEEDGDDASHKQFVSHAESSLTTVLQSLNNTMEKISLIERNVEKKYSESSMSMTREFSPRSYSAEKHWHGAISSHDDFGETVAFRAGWKRALELTDLIECQDENLLPDTSKSSKLLESRFILSNVKNDIEETRDDLKFIERERGHSEAPNESSRASGPIKKQHFSIYDSVLKCCSGKGEDLD